MRKFDFLRVYNSPFKPLKLKWYFGKVAVGVPYFLPRVWKDNRDKPGHLKSTPKKIGFDFVPMGWKTKWDYNDYRFEYSPVWSFVFFGYQIAVTFVAPHTNHYWECWLYYTKETDKTKSVRERILQARKEFPCVWTRHKNGVKEEVCYWNKILKQKKYYGTKIQRRR